MQLKDLDELLIKIYYTDSHVFMGDSVDFADSSDFRADSWTFFHGRPEWGALLSTEVRATQQNSR